MIEIHDTTKRKFLTIVSGLTMAFLTGCAALEEKYVEVRQSIYAKAPDQHLLRAFLVTPPTGKDWEHKLGSPFQFPEVDTHGYMFTVKQNLHSVANMGIATSLMGSTVYPGESDGFAQKYVEAAKARGNVVRLYKPQMTSIINKHFKLPIVREDMPQTRTWLGRDNALIEHDKSGRIVSFVSRVNRAWTGIGVEVIQYTTLYMGEGNARLLENTVKNSLFQEYLIREL